MIGYYRGFCRNFSSVVVPLTDLLKQSKPFDSMPEHQNTLEQVKYILTSTPLLAAPQMNKPFKLQVDASKVGVGTILLQDSDEGIE